QAAFAAPTASPDMPAFSKVTEDKIHSARSPYRLGSLLFCVTAARFPAFAEYATRLRSLSRSAAPFLADEATRCRWADAGLFLPADEAATGAVRCFHCGCRLPVRPDGPTDEPLRLHEQPGGEQCELLTLLKVAHGMLSERHDRVVATSAKLRRALAKLSSDLLERRSMLGLVESFGFARSSVLYCACRHFMTRGGQLACRPGDLIEMIREFEELQPDWGHVIDVEAVLSDCATLNESGASGERRQRPALEQQRPALEQQRPALEQQRPALEQQRPALEQQRPALEQQRPALEQQRPALEQQRPALEQQRPALEQQRPALEQQRPALEQQRPALEQQKSEALQSRAQAARSSKPQSAHAAEKSGHLGFHSQISVEEDAEVAAQSDKCLLCRERTRDHVTLPCAHFLLCRGCLSSSSACPQCGSRILGAVRAYIT
ncbi:hypothetical protein BOX15_Mlig030874g1, partial [Macrostomum lignano]